MSKKHTYLSEVYFIYEVTKRKSCICYKFYPGQKKDSIALEVVFAFLFNIAFTLTSQYC